MLFSHDYFSVELLFLKCSFKYCVSFMFLLSFIFTLVEVFVVCSHYSLEEPVYSRGAGDGPLHSFLSVLTIIFCVVRSNFPSFHLHFMYWAFSWNSSAIKLIPIVSFLFPTSHVYHLFYDFYWMYLMVSCVHLVHSDSCHLLSSLQHSIPIVHSSLGVPSPSVVLL